MTCERCAERSVTHLLVARTPADTTAVCICGGCIREPDDDNQFLVLCFISRDLEYANKKLESYISEDLRHHVGCLQELGA